ncbi:TPA: hypothetical protein NGR52_004199 [Vibrio parahaemolyticus]|nr:hypothetical protein [Vibrio parahaemolyticus]
MSELASTNNTVVSIVQEATVGVTPATPAFKRLRFKSESIEETLNSETDEEIRADGQYTDSVIVSGESGGEVGFNLFYGEQIDTFLQAALRTSVATWLTGASIMNGMTKTTFTIEKQYQDDQGNPIYFRYHGMQVGGMTINLQDGLLNGTCSFMGLDALSDTAIITGATYTDYDATAPIMSSGASVKNIQILDENDTDTGATVQDMTLTIDNGLRAQRALGYLYAAGVAMSRFGCEFSGNLYFSDKTIYDQFKLNKLMKLSFDLIDSLGNKYTFVINNLKTQSFSVSAQGVDQDLVAAWTARGFADDQSPSRTLTVTKTDVV